MDANVLHIEEGLTSMANPANRRHHILLVDDDPNMHIICKKYLDKAGYIMHSAKNGEEGLRMLQDYPIDLILLDYMMPGMDGYSFFKTLKYSPEYASFHKIPVIMLTVLSENHPQRKRLLKMGLSLYLNKPFGGKELLNVIENVFIANKIQVKRREQQYQRLQQARQIAIENRKLRHQLRQASVLHGIVGSNPKMKAIFERIKKVASTDANVLITGESGTGKELVARAIHMCSQRANGEFVPVDCVALPGPLLESELFGYEKGAFTGATHEKKGLFELAHRGTFFLDEIAELPIELQAKLLRVLQERQFRHLGGKELINVDIRVIAATNRDPLEAVKQGQLREDLYYRLNVVPIHLPPLRERREDIPLLVYHFLEKFSLRNGSGPMKISDDAMTLLLQYNWPGNVRELQNIVERMVSLASGDSITVDDLPEHIREHQQSDTMQNLTSLPLREARERWLEKFEKNYLIELLQECRGNISQVARRAGVNRMTIYRMLKKYNIGLELEIRP